MNQYPADRIRTVGLFGHGSAGKTSLVEAMLFGAEATTRLGRVDEGNTVTDFDPDEIKRKITISAAVAPIEWRDTKINLIDTPGYADFVGEVVSTLRVCDAALVVVDAAAGVEVGTEQTWHAITAEGIPKAIFINKMDRENADFDQTLESCRAAFGKALGPVQFPVGQQKEFAGIVDLLSETAICFHTDGSGRFDQTDIPDELGERCQAYRKQLVEAIAEHNEDLMVRYLEDDPITTDELRIELTRCVRDGSVVPVLCGSALTNRGMQPLLDAVVDLFPSAAETEVSGTLNGEAVPLQADPAGPLVALGFKTLADPHVGRVTFFRVFSGSLKSNSHAVNAARREPERVGQVFWVRGKEHLNAEWIGAGDIGATTKLGSVMTGDTVGEAAKPIVLAGFAFPEPSYSVAVHPVTKSDLDKMGPALQRVAEEDPTLKLGRDSVTGESILSGQGEPHVRIALDRMTRRFGVDVDLGLPQVAYRETISARTVAEYKHKKQTGGAGQYGHVVLELEPMGDDEFEFTERVVGGSVPRNYYPAVEKGVREGLEHGPVAGYPVVSIRVTLTDGTYHAVDSNEMSFKIASKEAFKKGILQANPVLLEPVLRVHVTAPDSFTGDVMSDLNTKRAHVEGMTPNSDGTTMIEASVPAAEVQRYATDLRSITQGRGSFTTQFARYQPVPPHIAEQIKASSKSHAA